MNNSSAVVSILILACVVIYYDEYQKKMNELKQEKEDADKERSANHAPESQDDDHSDTTAA